ncbi:MAG: hypothetical protein KJ623_02410 [Nanoarchaeota archaeon]|nr:hypothetical protein [Nanoarchaeota archaeon]MBU0962636.1 hypothetical protein [Nanoarchaeota archaeon]
MKVGVCFKRGLFLLLFLSLISVAYGAHSVDVQLINYSSFVETQNTNFTVIVNWIPSCGYPTCSWVNKINISIPLNDLEIINYQSLDNYPCSGRLNGQNYVINCTGVTGTPSLFLLNLTARVISVDSIISLDVYTIDVVDVTNINTLNIILYNDNSAPILGIPNPVNNTFTNNLSYGFSVDVSDPETGIDYGNFSYAKCGDIYKNESMICNQSNCNINLDISLFSDGDKLCYFYTIYNKGGSSNQSDLFLLNIDRSGPAFNLTNLELLNNTNDDDGIFDFNFSLTDDIGVSNCSLYINSTLVNATLNATLNVNMTYNVISQNNAHTFYIECRDFLNNANQTPVYQIYYDIIAPTIDSLVCTPNDGENGNGIVSCNITAIDPSGIKNCSLYINNSLVNSSIGNQMNLTATVLHSNNPYTRYVKCYDNAGNENTSSTSVFYYDNIAPVILNPNVDNSSISVKITWKTDEPANSSVYYGLLGLGLNLNVYSNIFELNHSLLLTSLNYSTFYDYNISSSDRWGNINTSSNTFNTTFYVPTGGNGGGGGGGGGGGSCTPDWACLQWSNCLSGQQTCLEYKKTCNKNPSVEYQTQTCSISTPEAQSSETGNNQEVSGPVGEMNKTIPITGAFIGLISSNLNYSLLLVGLLVILVGIYVFLSRFKYPKINPKLIENDLITGKLKSKEKQKGKL